MIFFYRIKKVSWFSTAFSRKFWFDEIFYLFCQWIRYLVTESIIHFSRIFYVVFLSHLYRIWDKANYFYYDVLEYWWFWHFHCDIRRLVSLRKLGKLQSTSVTIIFNLSNINIKLPKWWKFSKFQKTSKFCKIQKL